MMLPTGPCEEAGSRLPGNRFRSAQLPASKPAARLGSHSFNSARVARSKPMDASGPLTNQIRLNKTFLEVHDAKCDWLPLKPRACSDPGTEYDSEPVTEWSERSERMQCELDKLSERMNQIWQDRFAPAVDKASTSGRIADDGSGSVPASQPVAAHGQAFTAESEIPERFHEILGETAATVVTDVNYQIQELRSAIQANESDFGTAASVQKLDAIPELIMSSFEASFAAAKDLAQARVIDAIARLDDPESDSKDMFVNQGFNQASVEPALQAAPVAPALAPMLLARDARPTEQHDASDSRVKTATDEALAHEQRHQAVASWGERSAAAVNPGSMGHPELCPRPCLYFARGNCSQGMNCDFCHLAHSKRPSHLDKRNRDLLKSAHFVEVAALTVPLIRDRAKRLNFDPEALQILAQMEQCLVAFQGSIRSTRAMQALGNALSSLTLRSLLAMLQRAASGELSDVERRLEAHIFHVKKLLLPFSDEAQAVDQI